MIRQTLLIAATSSAALLTSHASAVTPGPFVGAQIGFGKTKAKTISTISSVNDVGATGILTQAQVATFKVDTANHDKGSLLVDLFAGYLAQVSTFFVGGEVAVGIDSFKSKKTVMGRDTNTGPNAFGAAETQIQLRRKWHSTWSALAGMNVIEPLFLYAKMGVGISAHETSQGAPLFPKKRHKTISLVPAVGAEYAVTKKIGVRAEGSIEFHKTTTGKSLVNDTDSDSTDEFLVTFNHKHRRFKTMAVKGGIVYHV